ncbi:hypothetical protein QQP08_021897 [Theobroma cacao]|nr:hypothetical protein QQP08_021897 [Theobroma cacao]
MCPTSSFLERFREESIVRFSNCSGIFPSSLFEDRSNHSRLINFPNDVKVSNETKLPMELGNAPERDVRLRYKCFNETKLPMELGNAPERDV